MLNWKHQLMGFASLAFVCGTVNVLTPTGSDAQRFGEFAPLERLTESGCVETPVWDEIIEGPRRWVATMDGAAYCDRQTGLVWDARPSESRMTWEQAIAHCLNRTVGNNGQLGWQLPEINQLASLVDRNSRSCQENKICLPDGHPFKVEFDPLLPEGLYWSVTPPPGPNNSLIQVVKFSNGTVDRDFKTSPFTKGWCVRGS